MLTQLNSSPSRTYIVPIHSHDFKSLSFRKFTLPEKAVPDIGYTIEIEVENTSEYATWYFYNKLDVFSCGKEAYPIEMHLDVKEV